MSFFKKNYTNTELEAKIAVLRGEIEQKDKEIAMWKERGNRLNAANDGYIKEKNDAINALMKHLDSQSTKILSAFDDVIKFKTYKEAITDQQPQPKDKK